MNWRWHQKIITSLHMKYTNVCKTYLVKNIHYSSFIIHYSLFISHNNTIDGFRKHFRIQLLLPNRLLIEIKGN